MANKNTLSKYTVFCMYIQELNMWLVKNLKFKTCTSMTYSKIRNLRKSDAQIFD